MDGNTGYVSYDTFSVASEAEKFALTVSDVSGTRGKQKTILHPWVETIYAFVLS